MGLECPRDVKKMSWEKPKNLQKTKLNTVVLYGCFRVNFTRWIRANAWCAAILVLAETELEAKWQNKWVLPFLKPYIKMMFSV
jgi:hypothetical protein